MVRGRKKKGTNTRCSSPTRACLGAHQVISPSIVTQSRHEPKIVTHGSDQQMLQHLLSIEQLPCVAGFRKGNGDVENERAEAKGRMRGRLVFKTSPTWWPTGMKQDMTGTPQTLQPRLETFTTPPPPPVPSSGRVIEDWKQSWRSLTLF